MYEYSFGECWRHHMANLWDKEITVDEQISLLEDFSSYLEVSMLVTIEKFKSIIILQKMGWLNDARDFLTNTLPEVCDEVGQYLVKSKLMNPPNWKIFLKDRLEIAKEAGQAIYSYHEKCFQICASQYQQQYQATYEQELAKQDGLGFGIISSSLAAHLVYAAQSASKERANEKKASEAADRIMHSSLSPVDKAAQMTIAFYHEKFDPFVNEFLIGFYSDIERLIYDGLDADKEALDNNKVRSGNKLANITEDNHRDCITASLSIYPFNGDALLWAIRYDDAGDELIEFCSANPLLLPKYLVAIEQSAVAYLKKQKEKADLYNRDPLTDEVIQLLLRIRTFLTDKRMYGISTYDSIIQDVYGEQIDVVCQKFDTLVKVKKTPLALSNYAKDNKSIYINSNDFEALVKYNAIFGTSKLKDIFAVIPDDPDAFNKMLFDLRQAIQSENERHQEAERQRKQRERELAEQKRREEEQRKEAEIQAELERKEQLKKKIKKVAVIVTPIVSALVIFLILLTSVIIPNGNYNKAVALMNDGKYEDAISAFEALNGYKDSSTKILECKYSEAIDLMQSGKYEDAIVVLKTINGFSDSSDIILNCELTLKRISYEKALELFNKGDYTQAKDIFSTISNYEDSSSYISKCTDKINENAYTIALNLLSQKKYDEAISAFTALSNYKDSPQKIKDAKLAKGEYLLAKKDYSAAIDIFSELGIYSNASQKLVQAKYEYANYYFQKGQYTNAINYYKEVGSYSNAESMLLKAQIQMTSVRSTIKFGLYEQDNNTTNGKEEIEWIVLAKENGKALLISKYCLDYQLYHNANTNITWENCSLRSWLNSSFYNSAFSNLEKEIILKSYLTNHDSVYGNIDGGNNTYDNVFLLSVNEAQQYFSSNGARTATATKYAIAKGAYSNPYSNNTTWLLRTPGDSANVVSYVRLPGDIDLDYIRYSDEAFYYAALRPAIWVDISGN